MRRRISTASGSERAPVNSHNREPRSLPLAVLIRRELRITRQRAGGGKQPPRIAAASLTTLSH